MAFSWRPRRAPTAVPPIRVPVFAVGADVYVACAGDGSARATLTDDAGKKDLASLSDGARSATSDSRRPPSRRHPTPHLCRPSSPRRFAWAASRVPGVGSASGSSKKASLMATDAKQMTERERADEKVRAIVEELDRPTLALLYRTLHDALGFRIATTDFAIGKLGR